MDVLIVDDDRLTRQGLMRFLPWDAFGLRVAGDAANGLEALDWMAHHHADLVLSDLEMPGMQGLEFIQKASVLYPQTYFVVLTIHTDFSKVQQALRLGAIDYIAKTDFDRESYSQILQRIVERIRKEQRKAATAPVVVDEKQLAAWKDLTWLWEDEKWQRMLDALKLQTLAPARIRRLCEDITLAWNDCYQLIAQQSITLPQEEPDSSVLYRWLEDLRKTTRKCFTSLPYSREIFLNIIQVGQHLKQHLDDPIRISAAANYAHMSRSYFCQCFHDIYHMSFLDYMRTIRLEKASVLLTDTNKTVQTIAMELGYNDEKYFSRIFRSLYNMTPIDYRKRNRG